jgi:hypothetical protein
MAIDAIAANIDTVWTNTEEPEKTVKIEQRDALKRFL